MASATTTSVAPAAFRRLDRRERFARHELAEAPVLETGGPSCSAVTAPATPSMSTEMRTFSRLAAGLVLEPSRGARRRRARW